MIEIASGVIKDQFAAPFNESYYEELKSYLTEKVGARLKESSKRYN